MKMKKKGQIDQLQNLIAPLIGVAIVLVVGFLIMAEAKSQVQSTDNVNSTGEDSSGIQSSIGWNSTSEVQEAMSDIPGWLPIIVITVIGALLIGLVAFFRSSGT